MRLGDIMSKPLLTVDAKTLAREAGELMRLKRVGHLAVLEAGAIVGIVSHHDLSHARIDVETVADVMTAPVVTATPRTTLRQAANLLRGRAIGCLPIVEDGRPTGIVTVSDVLELVGRGVERPVARSTRWTLKHRGSRRRVVSGKEGNR